MLSSISRIFITNSPAQKFSNLKLQSVKFLSISAIKQCTTTANESAPTDSNETPENLNLDPKRTDKDRTKIIPVEESIKYIKSAAYKETYGEHLVWEQYRRNHKGLFPPKKTRRTCIRQGKIATGNPCPICRDEYLVLDYRNLDLLNQFISPQTGDVLNFTKTGLCQVKHQDLLVAVQRSMDYGLITFDVPFRKYDYSEFYN